jgi:hypothetical protein
MTFALAFSDAFSVSDARRTDIRSQLGRKTATEIRSWANGEVHRAWSLPVADRLAASGYLTLSDVTDDEFDVIVG